MPLFRRRHRLRDPSALGTIAVTGAAGRVGQACLAALSRGAGTVRAIDLVQGSTPLEAEAEWVVADLRDAEQARRALAGATRLIHLAGWTAPDAAPPGQVLSDNVTIAVNVLTSFAEGGGRTAVVASSTSAYGLVWSPRPLEPLQLPVDEDHPCRPSDEYGLSKVVLEQTCAMLTRRSGLTTVALRFPWTAGDEPDRCAEFLTAMEDDPCGELGRRHLWTYAHVDDVVDAFVRSVAIDDGAAHVLNVASGAATGGWDAARLAERCFPGVPVGESPDCGEFLATVRARRLLGWSPMMRWTSSGWVRRDAVTPQ